MSLNFFDHTGDGDDAENITNQWNRLVAGESVSLNDSQSRDGMFEDDDLFLVYEKADIKKLIELAKKALEVSP